MKNDINNKDSEEQTTERNLIFQTDEKQLQSKKIFFNKLSENIFRIFEKLLITSGIYYLSVKIKSTALEIIAGLLMCILLYDIISSIEYFFYNLKFKSKHVSIRIIILLLYIGITLFIVGYAYSLIIFLSQTNQTN